MGVRYIDKNGEVRSMAIPYSNAIYEILRKQNRILYEVTSEIPMSKIKGRWADIVEKMSVGDSVLVASRAEAQGLQDAIHRRYWTPKIGGTKVAHNKMSRSRKEGEGFRVWRLQ